MPLLAVRGNGPAGAYGFGAASEKAAAMTAIASTTLSTTTTTVTFSSIPGTYDDLRVVIYGYSTAGNLLRMRINGITTGSYSYITLQGNGTTGSSDKNWGNTFGIYAETADGMGDWSAVTVDILNYANTTNNKSVLYRYASDRNSTTTGNLSISEGVCKTTSAVSSLSFHETFGANSVFALYGIKKAV